MRGGMIIEEGKEVKEAQEGAGVPLQTAAV
jgi:hypothetical protein